MFWWKWGCRAFLFRCSNYNYDRVTLFQSTRNYHPLNINILCLVTKIWLTKIILIYLHIFTAEQTFIQRHPKICQLACCLRTASLTTLSMYSPFTIILHYFNSSYSSVSFILSITICNQISVHFFLQSRLCLSHSLFLSPVILSKNP